MAIDGSKVIELLKSNLSSESRFALPSDGNKDVGNGRWTTYKHPKFSAAVKPANVAELQKTVSPKRCSATA